MSNRDSSEYFEHLPVVLNSIENSIASHNAGRGFVAPELSTQLYKLLIDRKGNISFIERIIPTFSLHPMMNLPKPGVEYDLHDLVHYKVVGNQVILEPLDTSKVQIPLEAWKNQLLFITHDEYEILVEDEITLEKKIALKKEIFRITIVDLLAQLRNTEGAHFLPNVARVYEAIKKRMPIIRTNGVIYPFDELFLVTIAGIVVEEVRRQLPNP